MAYDHSMNWIDAYTDWLKARKGYKKQSVDLQKTKQCIIKFKQTGYARDFAEVLKHTDCLIINTVFKLRNRHKHLQQVEAQELYQVGVIGLSDALAKMPSNETPNRIPMWIVSYVKSNIRKNFSYLEREHEEISECTCANETVTTDDSNISIFDYDLDSLTKMNVIDESEKDILIAKFMNNLARKNIARMFRISNSTVTLKLKSAVKKIRIFFLSR